MTATHRALPNLIAACGVALALSVVAEPASAFAVRADSGGTAQAGGLIPIEDTELRWRYVEVLQSLDDRGYTIVSVTTTLLNRVKIRARNAVHLREIIVSRASGQILRDTILEEYRPATRGSLTGGVDKLIGNTRDGIVILPE